MINSNSPFVRAGWTSLALYAILAANSIVVAQEPGKRNPHHFTVTQIPASNLQKAQCEPVTPVQMAMPARKFYDYVSDGNIGSSQLTPPYADCFATTAFLYQDTTTSLTADSLYLFVVHNRNTVCRDDAGLRQDISFTFMLPSFNNLITLFDDPNDTTERNIPIERDHEQHTIKVHWNFPVSFLREKLQDSARPGQTDGIILNLGRVLANDKFEFAIIQDLYNLKTIAVNRNWLARFYDPKTGGHINFSSLAATDTIFVSNVRVPQLMLTSKTLDFGNTGECRADARVVLRDTLKNTSKCPLRLKPLMLQGGAFTILNPWQGDTTLSPQASRMIKVEFKPNAAAPFAGKIKIFSNTPSQVDSVELSGASVDTTSPDITCGKRTVEFTATQKLRGQKGQMVEFRVLTDSAKVEALDACTPADKLAIKYFIGANEISFPKFFPFGTTPVIAQAVDLAGKTDTCRFNVKVDTLSLIKLSKSAIDFGTLECGHADTQIVVVRNVGFDTAEVRFTTRDSLSFTVLQRSSIPNPKLILPQDSLVLRIEFKPGSIRELFAYELVFNNRANRKELPDTLKLKGKSVDTLPPKIICRQDTIGCVDDPSKTLSIRVTATAVDRCSGGIDPNAIQYIITKFNGMAKTERIRRPSTPHPFPVGTTEVTCIATDVNGSGKSDTCKFTVKVVHFQSAVTIVLPEAADSVTCADRTSFTAQATTNMDTAKFFILEASFIIRGETIRVNVDTTKISNGFFSIPAESLHVGPNLIEAFVRVKAEAGKCRAEARTQFRLTRFTPNVGKIVINEILSNPNIVPKRLRIFDDDFDESANRGHERIELKNVSDAAISLRGMGLWIQRSEGGKTLNTVVHLPNRQLAKDAYLDIHYLANGDNDEVNFFTGLPQPDHTDSADAADGFSSDNSADPKKMLLGGLNNARAFAIALVDSIHLGLPETLSLSSCRVLDFVQIGGDVESMRRIAAQSSVVAPRGLWPAEARFIASAPAGSSYEFKEDSAKVLVTTPEHFVAQCLHSLGLSNKIDQPQANHLLITEVAVRPNFLQFIEIFNPRPKDSEPIALANYYLTNDGDAMPVVGMTPRNSYTTIVKGKDSLEVGESDFVVRFPKTDSIRGQTYLTIAIASSDTSSFFERYQNEPDYEIFFKNRRGMMNDRTVTNIDTIKAGKGPIKLRESDDVVVLFNWDGRSALVKDVDYVRWGKREAVNKTDLIINGRAYAADTPADQQKVIDLTNGHQLLKSWQRRQRPREFGEPSACDEIDPSIPTNGLAGHDETSESLAEAFQQAKPTPGEASGKLDLDFRIISDLRRPNGERNDKINPDETIQIKVRLKNLSDNPTGPLIGTLRIADDTTKQFIVNGVVSDSVAAFPSIPAGQAAYSDTSYVFSTKAISLPDSLRFTLFVIEKPAGAKSGLEGERLAAIGGEEVDMVVATNNVALKLIEFEPILISEPSRTILQLRHRLKHILNLIDPQTGRPTGALRANSIKASVTLFDPTLINTSITRTIRYKKDLDPQASTSVPDTFKLVTNKPFFGNETPEILLEYSWSEIAGDSLEPPTDTVFVRWPTRDTFKIRGVVTYFNQADKPVKGATVQLENNGVFKDTSTTDGSGNFVFSDLGRRDVGDYTLTVTHFGRPIGAIRKNDSTEVKNRFDFTLNSPKPENVTEVFKRIAADVTGNRIINRADSAAIVDKVRNPNSCQAFPVGKDWTFVAMDALGTTNLSNLSKVPESISFKLQNYNFENLRFAGIVYGDVDGSARPDTGTVECLKMPLISGVVTYFPVEKEVRGGQPAPQPTKFVGNVVVTIDGGKFAVDTTDSNGRYEFRNVPIDLSYRIKLAKTDSFTIKKLDRYINFDDTPFLIDQRTRSELEGWQKIAADVFKVDTDPDFPVADIVLNNEDRDRLINFVDPSSNIIGLTGQWRFRQCSIMNLSPSDPGCDMRFPMFDPRRAMQDTIVAVLLGDIDGSWPSEGGERGGIAKAGEKLLNYSLLQDLEVTPGDSFTLPLRMEPAQEIAAAKLNLQFEAKQLEVVSITKGKALENYLLQDDIKPEHIQATLSGKTSRAGAGEIFLITFRVIGKVGESSLLELKEFSVNETAMAATGRVRLVKRIPKEHFLSQNYPNPFNPSTTIEYGLPYDEQVRLQIFNVIGQIVFTIVDERQEAGYYHLNWNGQDGNGRSLPAGVYFMRLQAGKFSKVRKLALVK